ncbi:MAG: radical SAM protein [Lachnospiraceae bacterium]|nr:radical SAM protein [Lachnospiraceae bacterium]
MKNAYLAICYICNENCIFCPCSKVEKQQGMITDITELINTVNILKKDGVTDVTISGGEPTLHPNLPELVSYIQKKGMNVTILSNSEKFADVLFINKFMKLVTSKSIKVITTLHSGVASEHEDANQTPKSFERSIAGLHNLCNFGVRVIIKHCITKKNYKDLIAFFKYCDDTFEKNVDIQLCSIDYCGIPKNELENEKLTFKELKPFLEELFDLHIEQNKVGIARNLYCINIPLCSCDPYYWKYLPYRKKKMYSEYKDPHNQEMIDISDNVGIHQEYCKDCKMTTLCNGTYFTAYSAVGLDIVEPFQ